MGEMKRILGSRMKELTPEQKEFKNKLFKKCLSRYNRNLQLMVKIEVCKPGFALGSVETFIEKQTAGWRGCGGMGNLGKRCPFKKK